MLAIATFGGKQNFLDYGKNKNYNLENLLYFKATFQVKKDILKSGSMVELNN